MRILTEENDMLSVCGGIVKIETLGENFMQVSLSSTSDTFSWYTLADLGNATVGGDGIYTSMTFGPYCWDIVAENSDSGTIYNIFHNEK